MVVQGARRVPGAVVGGEAGLAALHARVAGRFARPEVRARARRYLAELLGRAERKNGWQLAEALGEAGPQGVQRLLNAATWDAEGVRADLRAYVVEHLGDAASGVLIVDETSFVKKGKKSCGVGTQYAGAVGGTANAQVGVFLAYASAKGTAFVDRALYLPRAWAHDPARRAESGVPAGVRFATKLTLAQRLLARAFAAGVPARWVAGDAAYGRSHAFRRWLEDRGRAYALSVPWTHAVHHDGRRQTAAKWAAALPAAAWRPRSAGAGVQGERVDAWACVPLAEATAPGWRRWLLVRRWGADSDEVAFYVAFGPAGTTEELVRVCGMRWQVEEGFAQAKGEVGLDQDEVRTWTAWHRFVTLALLAHASLAVTRLAADLDEAAEKGGADPGPPDLLPLTVPEVRRLLLALAERGARRAHRLRWSRWRRAHQARANRCHAARRPRTGRPRNDHRAVVGGIPWVLRNRASWRDMPARFGNYNTAYKRYRLWSATGLWERLLTALRSATDDAPAEVLL